MADRVLLSAGRNNAEETIALASEYGLGIEIMCFSFPDVLDEDWQSWVTYYKKMLHHIDGKVTMHGPFMDMVSGSPDARVNAVCVARYGHVIRIAADLGVSRVVLHANFIGSLHNTFYREGWHQRNVGFWISMAEYAQQHDVTIAMENMWEFDPTIIANLLQEVNHPNLRACVDVGHAHLFTDKTYTFDYWLRVMEPWLDEFHINNNNGILDEHHGLDWEHGVLNYHELLPKMREIAPNADMTLEMNEVEDMRDSLHYFQIEGQTA